MANDDEQKNLDHTIDRHEDDLMSTHKDLVEARRDINALAEILKNLIESYSYLDELRPARFIGAKDDDPSAKRYRLFAEAEKLMKKFPKQSKNS